MESFSQRKGLKPIKNAIQIDSIDENLRNRLWNALTICYWSQIRFPELTAMREIPNNLSILIKILWHDYYKKTIDTIPYFWKDALDVIKAYFFSCKWHEVYDIIEFAANKYGDDKVNTAFMDLCNSVLKEESSAYRFVGGKITQITSKEEIAEIENAQNVTVPPVQQHINRALELLSDRKSPDYRNSIKESISAVEAICKLISKNNTATLGLAIETIEKGKKVKMHPALGRGFSNLYGYTNAADGIRHALMDEPNLDFEDAKFMLVSCSAFINYLMVKSTKAGIVP